MRFLEWLLFPARREPSEIAYQRAMGVSDDLIRQMRESSGSHDAARAVMSDVWAQHHNVPYMTSIYQTMREMKSATTDLQSPPPEK